MESLKTVVETCLAWNAQIRTFFIDFSLKVATWSHVAEAGVNVVVDQSLLTDNVLL